MVKFDELNRLKKYFSVMEIPQSEQDKRVSLGWLFYDAFLYVLLLMQTEYRVNKQIEKDFYVRAIEGRIRDILEDNNIPYDEDYVPKVAEDVIETTLRHQEEEYYYSQERALLIAQNEANTVMNSVDFQEAKLNGKTHKTWISEKDSKVRLWHEEVDSTTVKIDEPFHVGGDLLDYPHDYIHGSPENLINCRCTCRYD